VLAVGPHADNAPGVGPVIVIATGQLVETELAACVRAMVGRGGGELTATTAAGRTMYRAKDGNYTMYFAFGRADTVVLGADESFVLDAIGAGKKISDEPEMKRWLQLADHNAPLWGAGRVDERVRGGLVRLTNGQLAKGALAYVVAFDPTAGAKLDFGAVMATAADAKTLESFAKTQLVMLAAAAQAQNLGWVVDRMQISVEGEVVRFRVALDLGEVNQLISVLDGQAAAAQDSPPATGSGSSAGP